MVRKLLFVAPALVSLGAFALGTVFVEFRRGVSARRHMVSENPARAFVNLVAKSVTAAVFRVVRMVCRIDEATLLSGVVALGLMAEVGSITNQPYCELWIGACT